MTRRHMLMGLGGLAAVLAGCGRKPSFVDPPPGVAVDVFPRDYPADDEEPPAVGRRTYPAE